MSLIHFIKLKREKPNDFGHMLPKYIIIIAVHMHKLEIYILFFFIIIA